MHLSGSSDKDRLAGIVQEAGLTTKIVDTSSSRH